MPTKLNSYIAELKSASNFTLAKNLSGFFKTGKGQYGEGDVFLGIYVPNQRKISKKYLELSFTDLSTLLKSKIHEHRLGALFILNDQFNKADTKTQKKIFEFYLKNAKSINNWDLVDLSAPRIVGMWLNNKPKDILYKLAHSNNLWQKRIAIISTLAFIREKHFEDTLKIAEILLDDTHDLIHKAAGWMLREVGKKDVVVLKKFLDKHCKKMPRTMLRYAIEKFNKKDYQYYLLCSRP
ncbi:MAG: putative DNA alkylation repair enzyme [uncultured bacterium]|nr:MAG: putative DNA alkylation repair enzyme [uncultured bacterium]